MAEDGRTLSVVPATTNGFEVVGARVVSALSPAPSIMLGREQTQTHNKLANERAVGGHSREGIEGLSGLLFRERRSVQQGGEERIEIAGTGELKGKATIPKPRFSPKMKHDSCIPSTKLVRMATNVRSVHPVAFSNRTQCVASSLDSNEPASCIFLLFLCVGEIQASGASHT